MIAQKMDQEIAQMEAAGVIPIHSKEEIIIKAEAEMEAETEALVQMESPFASTTKIKMEIGVTPLQQTDGDSD